MTERRSEAEQRDWTRSKRIPVPVVRFLYRWAVVGLLHEGKSEWASRVAAEGKSLVGFLDENRSEIREKN